MNTHFVTRVYYGRNKNSLNITTKFLFYLSSPFSTLGYIFVILVQNFRVSEIKVYHQNDKESTHSDTFNETKRLRNNHYIHFWVEEFNNTPVLLH